MRAASGRRLAPACLPVAVAVHPPWVLRDMQRPVVLPYDPAQLCGRIARDVSQAVSTAPYSADAYAVLTKADLSSWLDPLRIPASTSRPSAPASALTWCALGAGRRTPHRLHAGTAADGQRSTRSAMPWARVVSAAASRLLRPHGVDISVGAGLPMVAIVAATTGRASPRFTFSQGHLSRDRARPGQWSTSGHRHRSSPDPQSSSGIPLRGRRRRSASRPGPWTRYELAPPPALWPSQTSSGTGTTTALSCSRNARAWSISFPPSRLARISGRWRSASAYDTSGAKNSARSAWSVMIPFVRAPSTARIRMLASRTIRGQEPLLLRLAS